MEIRMKFAVEDGEWAFTLPGLPVRKILLHVTLNTILICFPFRMYFNLFNDNQTSARILI